MNKTLTLEDFKADYQNMLVRWGSKSAFLGFHHHLIARWYAHIDKECYAWLEGR